MAPFTKPSWWPSFAGKGRQQEEGQQEAPSTQPLTQLELAGKVQKMVSNSRATGLARARGLAINTVCWEDCARSKGSCWGPCISDMTLRCSDLAMPVIRAPNYTDTTWDVPMDNVMLVVGNETPVAPPVDVSDTGAPTASTTDATPADRPSPGGLTSVSLTQFLRHAERYTGITIRSDTSPASEASGDAAQALSPATSPTATTGLLAPERDSHALVSAQACFLPVAASGEAEFQVCLYNYQSRADDPAVLVLVVSSQGTSAQVSDGTYAGQNLWFNDHGTKRPFQAVRLKDDRAARGVAVEGAMSEKEKQDNVLLVIQVPLKQRPQPQRRLSSFGAGGGGEGGPPAGSLGSCEKKCKASLSNSASRCRSGGRGAAREAVDVDHAIVKLGRAAGEFTSLAGKAFERDARYPVRVTLQYYKCTSNAEVDENVIGEIAQQMAEAQSQAEFWGSLVTSTTNRPTEHTGPHVYANPAAQ